MMTFCHTINLHNYLNRTNTILNFVKKKKKTKIIFDYLYRLPKQLANKFYITCIL